MMKRGLLLGGVLAAFAILYMIWLDQLGPRITGPEKEVSAVCNALKVGMTHKQVASTREDVVSKSENPSVFNPNPNLAYIDKEKTLLQVEIGEKSGFVCVCQVDMDDRRVAKVRETFCSD